MDFLLQDIRDKTEKYQNEILSLADPKKPLASLQHIRSVLTDDLKSIIITNLKFKNSKIQYVTRITRERVELSEKNLGHDSHVLFQFDDNCIYYNKKKMNDLFRLQFNERIQNIIQDIEKSKTTVYEEVAPRHTTQSSHLTDDSHNLPIIEKKSIAELELEAKKRRLKEMADQEKENRNLQTKHSTYIDETSTKTITKSAELRQKYSPNYVIPKTKMQTESGIVTKAGSWLKSLFT